MIQELKSRTRFENKRFTKCYAKFEQLISELRTRNISDNVKSFVNQQIEIVNRNHDEKELKKQVRKSMHLIIKKLEKEDKIVPKGYYKQLWLALGMSVFGIPFGVAFGAALGNMAFLGLGLPIGMTIGIAIGTQKDNDAAKNGRQLNFTWG
jgi:hypothetical protein